jgi:predicted transcriptional regulator
MNKAVMLSIRPKWCEKIASGEKTIEVRKTRLKMETPFKCYIYCTSGRPDLNIPISPERLMQDYLDTGSMKSLNCPLGNGKVIGEFVCDRIYELETRSPGGSYYVKGEDQPTTNDVARQSCLSLRDMHDYLHAQKGYGWHISNLKIYDAPKKLGEFWRDCLEYSELSTNCWSCENVCGDGDETDCNTDGRLYLHRPPQSWCYVEAIDNG